MYARIAVLKAMHHGRPEPTQSRKLAKTYRIIR
jgi:hypothetical protein